MTGGSPSGESGSAPAGLGPGSVFAGYRVESRIGAGGMAVVFRAREDALGRTVALKVLAPALAGDAQFRERFIRASREVAAVEHPHIIPVYAAGEADGLVYLAMRFVSGGDLRAVLEREGRLTGERATALLSPIASALDGAHAEGLVHGDVKPANILIDARPGRPEHPYLSDFGLAGGAMLAAGGTGIGEFLGGANYVAPEQISGTAAGPRTDQYSLACVAYTLLAGMVPFAHDNIQAVIWAHRYAEPPSLAGQPPAVDAVFARALAKSPEDRYGTCEEFIAALRAALGAGPQAAPGAGSGPMAAVTAPEPAPDEGGDLYAPPAPDDDSEAVAPGLTVAASDSGQTVTADTVGSDATQPPGPAQPAGKRPGGRRRALIAAVAAIVVVAGVGALLAVHPWTQPPVLKPAGLTVEPDAAGGSGTSVSVKIGWSAPATGPLPGDYEIFRNGVEIGTVLGSETSYVAGGLTPSTSYGFQVQAVRGGRQSPVSATLTALTPPLRPAGLDVRRETTSSVEIAWSGPAAGPAPGRYEILRDGSELTTVPGSITSYTDKGLEPDTGYSYQVIAVTGSDKSQASATLTAAHTTKPPLSAAVLNWNGMVTEKSISVIPAAPGWRLQPGQSTQDGWNFQPDCSSGPCDTALNGSYDGYTFATTLTRSGRTYTGSATLKNDFDCSLNKSISFSGTITITITVHAASAQGYIWQATSFSGQETVYAPAFGGCLAVTGQLDVKS